MGDPVSDAKVWNIANGLTLLRLLLVPAFVVLLVQNGGHSTGWRVWAFVAFAVACVTDLVDGDLARRRNLVTEIGKIADPIADKALIGAALLGLSSLGDLPWWVTAVVLVRELGITAAVLRDPARRDPGEPGRQAEDAGAEHRDRAVCAAADRLAGDRSILGDGRGVGADRRDRRGLRLEGGHLAPDERAHGLEAAA